MKQIRTIQIIKKYLDSFKRNFYHPCYDNAFYIASYSNNIGNLFLKKKIGIKISFLTSCKIILKDIFYSCYYYKPQIIFDNNEKIENFERIIVTWCFKDQFNFKDGSFLDRYLNINTNSLKKTLWFCIYMSDKLPKKVEKNIILYKPKQSRKNFLFLLKILFTSLKKIKYGFKYFINNISSHNVFADQFIKALGLFIHSNIKFILLMYEGQPFQNNIIKYVKKRNYKTNIIGYVHSPPLGLPTNFIKKKFSPDKLILNGEDQKKCFTTLLGWKKNEIKLFPSRRFLKKKKKIDNFIFLPNSFTSTKFISSLLKNLIIKKKLNLMRFKVRLHPGAKNVKTHENFKKHIEKLIEQHSNKESKALRKFSIFIGASGAVIEALENNVSVYHICENTILEKFSQNIWQSIKVKKINDNTFEYSLKKKNNLIKFGRISEKIDSYFKI